MLTARELLQNSPQGVIGRATMVLTRLKFQEVVEITQGAYHVSLWETQTRGKGIKYTTEVWLRAPVSQNSECWVGCSCPYWLYYMEVAVARGKSTGIRYSNGRLPVVKNPEMIPGVCKHLYRVIIDTLAKAPQINQSPLDSLTEGL